MVGLQCAAADIQSSNRISLLSSNHHLQMTSCSANY